MKKIIYADDYDSFRKNSIRLMKGYLMKKSIEAEIDEAVDGGELSGKVIGGDYDLVFTDNGMRPVSGMEAINKIREAGKQLPICMISAGDPDDAHLAMELGATDYIEKDDKKLKEKMESILLKYLAG
jgi:CheY-like chemotaxis protein